jgi:endo-1,4-beta-xylanase
MYKKFTGIMSLAMAGMLAASSFAPASTAMAADEEVVLLEEAGDVAEEATLEEASEEELLLEDEAGEASSEEETVEITPENPEEENEEVENTLEFRNRWDSSDKCGNKITFAKQYQEYVYEFSEAFQAEDCNEVVVAVANQTHNVCFKLYNSDMTEKQASYTNVGKTEYEVVPTYSGDDIKYLGIMSMVEDVDAYPQSIIIKDIKADVTATSGNKENEQVISYGPESMKFKNRWTGEEVEGNTLSFVEDWNEYWFHLNRGFKAEKVKSITVKTKDQSASLAFKIYDADGKELEPFYGKNGYNEYTVVPTTTGTFTDFAFMADQNNKEYPVKVTVESVVIVEDTSTDEEEEPSDDEVEYDIVNLRDAVGSVMGDDFIIGTAISYMEFADEKEMALVTKHFNGCTLGNELKPDSMISKTELTTYELDGEEVQFPVLNFSTPDRYLDFFMDWNEKHPEKFIKIRGHVLLWHAQTPEIIFHEDFDTSKPYVTPEVMNKRLEVYIREVAKHYVSEDSKYKDLFYGWDVVNEAISDGTGSYRTLADQPASSWWGLYQSPEFIQNAFVYANKYYPSNIALFYNDYNDTSTNKVNGICKLLETVKATPGARIDGFGMQGHYQIANNDPSMDAFKKAATRYAQIVDQVQVTELDFKGSKNSKDERLAQRYKDLYDTIRRLRNEGVNITGMTIWGVVDKHSWLQNSNSVGGAASGKVRQYPLLFNDHYKAKNAFWALVDGGELMPEIRTVTLVQLTNDDFSAGESYSFKTEKGKVNFVPMWEEGGLAVKVSVEDATVEDTDKIVFYATDGSIKKNEVTRAEATATDKGYEAVLKIAVDAEKLSLNAVKLDLVVNDGEQEFAFGDTQLKQSERTDYYAETVLSPVLAVNKGTVEVNAKDLSAAWDNAAPFALAINGGAEAKATAKVLWDDENLYVLAEVKDSVLNKDSSDDYQQDSIEVFIDENNAKASAYEEDDKQYRINYENKQSFNGTKCTAENVTSDTFITEDGYRVVAAFKWTDITPEAGKYVGFDVQVNDADNSGKRTGTLNWADGSGNGWSSPSVFGTIILSDEGAAAEDEGEFYKKWGSTYFRHADGTNHVGLLTFKGQTFFFNEKGHMVKNTFVTIGADEFYFGSDGAMVTGVFSKWGNTYFADAAKKGAIQKDIIVKIGDDFFYFDKNGIKVAKKLVEYKGDIFYFDKDGKMVFGKSVKWNSHTYFFDTVTGKAVINDFRWVDGDKFYFGADGRAVTGIFTVGADKYAAGSTGKMYIDTVKKIKGMYYLFDAEGKVIQESKKKIKK